MKLRPKTKENGDAQVLVTTLREHTKKVCKEAFLDGNSENSSLPEQFMVVKIQIIEILRSTTETWQKDFVGHKGRVTSTKSTTTCAVDSYLIVKSTVNDIDEVPKGTLIEAEDKERDKAAKKIVKTIKNPQINSERMKQLQAN